MRELQDFYDKYNERLQQERKESAKSLEAKDEEIKTLEQSILDQDRKIGDLKEKLQDT